MTTQQAPERRPKKIDLNLLPAEYRPPQKSYLGLALYLIVFILICAVAVLIVMKTGVDSDAKSLDQNLTSLEQQITTLQANKAEADPIKNQITIVQSQLANMQSDYQTFINSRLFWSEIITEIDDLVPGKKILLESITDRDEAIDIGGMATKRIYVYDYAVDLEQSDFFSNVDFNFGDCPETSQCNFGITVELTTANQTAGEINE